MSAKRAVSILVILAAIAGAGYYLLHRPSGPPAPQAAGPPPQAPASATSAVQLELVKGTAAGNNARPDAGDFAPPASPAALNWTQLSAGSAGGLNPVVLNAAGKAVYRFDKDSATPPTSRCTGSCADTWPPVLVKPGSKVFADGVETGAVGSVTRPDGRNQVTLGGWPLYTYSGDTQPGQVHGQGVGGTWFAAAPDGGKAQPSAQGNDGGTGLTYTTGTARQNKAPADTGDFFDGPRTDPKAMKWVELSSGSAGGLSPIVHNGVGRTIYRFDKDTPRPSRSHCTDQCQGTWLPILVVKGSRIFVNGVPTAKVGIINRPDGTRQVTLGGWPLYLYSGDARPSDTAGQGVDGTWFAVSPSGGKVQR